MASFPQTPEAWTFTIGFITLVLWIVFQVPPHWSLLVGVGLAIVFSTLVLGAKTTTSRGLQERLRNATEDDIRMSSGFLWGTATAAHQCEGDQDNDWTEMERERGWEPSGITCDVWNLFPHDVKWMKWLGLTCHRFSIEWSRIQPDGPESWEQGPLDKYVGWCKLLRDNGIEPILTLHHFSSPKWLVSRGGFENVAVCKTFAMFAMRVAEAVKPYTRYFITFNEPTLYALHAAVLLSRPGDRRYTRQGDLHAMVRLMRNLVAAHAEAYHAIHDVHPGARVSIAKNVQQVEPRNRWNPIDCFLAAEVDRVFNFAMLDALTSGVFQIQFGSRALLSEYEVNPRWANTLDFVGVNSYNVVVVSAGNRSQLLRIEEKRSVTENPKSQMNWEMCPCSMLQSLRKVAKYNLPVFVTESGCADPGGREDHHRQQFLVQSLACVSQAAREGINMAGFCQWASVSCREWETPQAHANFGLIDVDFAVLKQQHATRAWKAHDFEDKSRSPTGSAHVYRRIIAAHRDCYTVQE